MKTTTLGVLISLLTHLSASVSSSTDEAQASASVLLKPGATLVTDTFDHNHNDWGADRTGRTSVEVTDGRLLFDSREPGRRAESYMTGTYTDVDISVEITLESGDDGTMMGAACRQSGNDDSYWFFISGDGHYGIKKYVNGKVSSLVDNRSSDVIHTGRATNRVEAICERDRLQLVVNHRILATVKDGELSAGRIGVAGLSITAARTLIAFDNLTVSVPGPCPAGWLTVYGPSRDTSDARAIDGRVFHSDAETLAGSRVAVTATVVEAKHLVDFAAGLDGTLVLVFIPGADGRFYRGLIFLPDGGQAVSRYMPNHEIKASGIHRGYDAPPIHAGFFDSFPDKDGRRLPSMTMDISSTGCLPPDSRP